MVTEAIWERLFDGRFEDRQHAIRVFEEHMEEVQRIVPPERLLLYHVKEGMTVEEVAPGCATVSMVVRADMLNGHAICHGGFIFTLADSAFAFACNSYNANTVAAGARIDFLAPAHEGDRLLATATELALFRGNSFRIQGSILDHG